MARKEKKSSGGGEGGGWIVTFSDLMTLLLTFFVLLLSMIPTESATLQAISDGLSENSNMIAGGAGSVPQRIQVVTAMLRDPDTVRQRPERIKDLMFPYDNLPPEITRGMIEKNVEILDHPEGVVIVLTGDLLFEEGSPDLDAKGITLLEGLATVIMAVNSDVNISGHTDNTPGRALNNDDLSALRALTALEYFLQQGLKPERFSVSGYGPDRPLYPNDTPENRTKNRRVEVLLKTANRFAGY